MAANVETIHCGLGDLFSAGPQQKINEKLRIFLPPAIQPTVDAIKKVTITTDVTSSGPIYKYEIEWREKSGETLKKWQQKWQQQQQKSTLTPNKSATSVRLSKKVSNLGQAFCDGPCQSMVDATSLIQFGCDHLICEKCRISQKAAPLFDGSPGCCNVDCLTIAKFSGEKIRSGNLSKSSSFLSVTGPFESINVHLTIVKRLHNNVVRNYMEYEFSTQSRLASLRHTLTSHKKIVQDSRVYYSFRKPEKRDDLNLISLLDTNLRFYDLAARGSNNQTELYFVIIGKGVRV